MLNNLKIRVKLIGMQAVMLTLLAIVSAAGMYGSAAIKEGLRTTYEDRVVSLVRLSRVLDDLHRMRANVQRLARTKATGDDDFIQKFGRRIADAEDEYNNNWRDYISTYMNKDEKILSDAFSEQYKTYLVKRNSAVDLIKAGVRDERLDAPLADATDAEAGSSFTETRNALKKLMALQERVALEEYTHASRLYDRLSTASIALILVARTLGGRLSLLAHRSITVRVKTMTAAMHELATGNNVSRKLRLTFSPRFRLRRVSIALTTGV